MELARIMEQVAAKNGVSPEEVRREIGAALGVSEDGELERILWELAARAVLGFDKVGE